MRLVQVVNTLDSLDGGPARNSFELNQALNGVEGVHAQLIAMNSASNPTTLELDDDAGRLTRDPKPVTMRKRRALTSLRTIAASDVVVVHGYYLGWVPGVMLAARLLRKPVLVMPHGAISEFELGRSPVKKRIFDALTKLVAGPHVTFVTGSAAEASDLRVRMPDAAVEVAGVGASWAPKCERVRVDDSDRVMMLLSVSRIARKKRIDLMLGAVAELKSTGEKVRLIVAGSGERRDLAELQALARELDILDEVDFVGQVGPERKAALYNMADVFLLPSDDENFGIGLAEAITQGVPSIVSDKVGAAEGISPLAVRVLKHPSAKSVAAAVTGLRDPSAWEEAHHAALSERETGRLSWVGVADRWLRIAQNARHITGVVECADGTGGSTSRARNARVTRSKFRNVTQLLLFALPSCSLKNRLLNLLGHEVSVRAKIGASLVWDIGRLEAGDGSHLRRCNIVRGVNLVQLDSQAIVGSFNYISASNVFRKLFPRDRDYSVLSLGVGAKIATRHTIDCSARVEIGAFASIAGHGTTFLSHSTEVASNSQVARPIVVGERTFVGSHVLLLGGASVASNSVLGAGSVVTRWRGDAPPQPGFWAGSPARYLRDVTGRWFDRTSTRTTTVFDPLTGEVVDNAF